ncbi:MAG: 50S ribosomal protein L10 [Planctomycetota bacterium]|mgnify:CR=1 FL=1
MSKAIKAMIEKDLRERYTGVNSACVVELTGMDVQSQEKLRKSLRGKSARLEVIRNSMARQAFKESPLAPLGQSLEGPCALVTGSSPVDIAKLLMESAKEFAKLKLKKAIFEGDPNLLTVAELSKLRGRKELLGELAFLLMSPARAIAGCLKSPQAKIAGCLKALIEKAETQPEPA